MVALRLATHDSGPGWFATPFLYDSFIHNSTPVYPGALNNLLGKFRNELARWFDNAMDRLSGVYKRKTQAWSFALALIMAAVLNVSAIDVGLALWQRPIALKAMMPMVYRTAPQAVAALQDLGTDGSSNRMV
jgi:hypothetical protein